MILFLGQILAKWWSLAKAKVASDVEVHPAAEAAVRQAIRELGRGERHRNNGGAVLHRYRDYPFGRDADMSRSIGEWCAFFVGYCFEEGCRRAGIPMPFKRRFYDDRRGRMMPVGGAKALGQRMLMSEGREVPVDSVRRGDVLVWDRGRAGSRAGHIGIVEKVDRETRTIHTIEGNVGRFPAKVRRRQWDMDRPGRLVAVVGWQ